MIFVSLGRLLAWGCLILGAVRTSMGFYVGYSFTDPAAYEVATARYLGTATSGEAIDQGLTYIAVGVAFGLLAEIAGRIPRANTEG